MTIFDLQEPAAAVAQGHEWAPLGRFATPQEIALSIVFLLLVATFVTGQCLVVDGGWTTAGK